VPPVIRTFSGEAISIVTQFCPTLISKSLDTCYSAAYMSQTRDQQCFTILEVAADWHEPMVPQLIMWPSTARANGQLDHGAASRHTITQSATLGLYTIAVATTHFPSC